MDSLDFIKNKFKNFDEDFYREVNGECITTTVEAKQELIKEGQKVTHIPILISGLVKVFTLNDGKELLYYYIEPSESCIMTFSSIFTDKTSRIYACTEEKSEVLLLPVSQFLMWLIKYPQLNQVFFLEYDLRYKTMMDTISQVVFQRLDKRIFEYLGQRIKRSGNPVLKISHKKIAEDLGTAREVVSRILKKFEKEGLITQSSSGIEIINK
ncbi:Crp/Fnr family transcriptional regulator [Epilithonimonas sp. UC225_85]|uniref:Crp/Fnr family transcriptional regulator n=1 Tax=Epilithonimonas sp. UC225_85 TaxID=3350167 RepID=UPI0036D2DBA9